MTAWSAPRQLQQFPPPRCAATYWLGYILAEFCFSLWLMELITSFISACNPPRTTLVHLMDHICKYTHFNNQKEQQILYRNHFYTINHILLNQLIFKRFLLSADMGNEQTKNNEAARQAFTNFIAHPQQYVGEAPQQKVNNTNSSYKIPELEQIIKKAFNDLNSRDPMGKRLYLNQVLNFILSWIPKTMEGGTSLFDAEKIVRDDLERACKEYPIAEIQPIKTTVEKVDKPHPDLFADVKIKNKETFTDRIKELCLRSKQVSYEFNKEMQLILEKDGGYKFITGYKYTGTKAYLRIMTKILDPFLSEQEQSRQVYKDLNHYYYAPVFKYFNRILDKQVGNIKIEVYDWIRCKCSFKNIEDLERAYRRLEKAYGANIFRVKNRINQGTRDLLINLKFKTEYAEVQLALKYNDHAYEFQHKLYELTRQKLGVAYSCFTFMLHQSESHSTSKGVMTQLGYLKKTFLREKVEKGFERLTAEDLWIIQEDVKKVLGNWTIAALKTGVADAVGKPSIYKSELYGPDVEEMLIIKKRSTTDRIYNWLNWMDEENKES